MVGNVWEFVEQLAVPSAQAMENMRIQLNPSPREDEPWYQIRGESFGDPLAQGVIWDSTTVPARWAYAEHRLPLRQGHAPMRLSIAVLFAAVFELSGQPSDHPTYLNPDLPAEQRAADRSRA